MRVLVIIPAYNEEESLGSVIEETREHLPFADVVVVNDGSLDSTSRIAEEKGVFLLNLPYNLGIGTAMQTGYIFADENDYDIAVQIDGDGQHDPSEAMGIIGPVLEEKADVVIGSRYLEERGYKTPLARRVGIALFSSYISLIVRRRITDPTSGFRAANRQAIRFLSRDYPSDYPEPEAVVLLHRNGFRILEVPITMRERRGGRSSITFLRACYYMIKVSLAIFIGLFRRVGNGD